VEFGFRGNHMLEASVLSNRFKSNRLRQKDFSDYFLAIIYSVVWCRENFVA
jgi:hypothetical protein